MKHLPAYILELINFIFKGFGFVNVSDFYYSTFKVVSSPAFLKKTAAVSTVLATLFTWVEQSTGLDILVVAVFLWLIIAEFQTGLKADIIKRGERFKSRKFGRMLLKCAVYVILLSALHILAERFDIPPVFGIDINPFMWVYYFFFVAIVLQLLISYLENLSVLGYSEVRGLRGALLRKFNKWFEFDGTKTGNSFDNE
jgi:hypothetical protein